MTTSRASDAPEQEVCLARDLLPMAPCVVPLERGPDRRPRSAIVIRDFLGRVHGYLNRCEHLPIPLSARGQDMLSDDGHHLMCRTHGACYRVTDGMCVAGPCEGKSLVVFRVEERDGRIWLRLPSPQVDL